MRKTPLVEFFWKVHPAIYRASGGRLLGRLAGMDVLLLTTTGARSGRERTTALTFVKPSSAPNAHVTIGSFLGEPRDPGWVHNLRGNPEARIQVGRRRFDVSAREAVGAERERLWEEVCQAAPEYRSYEGRTKRTIPVMVLEPRET